MKKSTITFEMNALWHPTKNGPQKLEDFSPYSHEKMWWKCPNEGDHEWEASIASITISTKRKTKSNGCPFCGGKKVTHSTCLAWTNAKITQSWHPSKNAPLTPNDVTKGSNKIVWWVCPKGEDHEWKASINNRVKQDQGCPFCKGKRASKNSNIQIKFPDIAEEWDCQKNLPLSPIDVTPGSNKIASWKCPQGHSYRARISHRCLLNSGCPYCSKQKLLPENSLAISNPNLAKEFHPTKNGITTPYDIFASSGKNYWWLCSVNLTHEWEASVDNRKKGTGCPYCSGKKTQQEDSFATLYPELLQEWDYKKNKLNPLRLRPKSNLKAHWQCSKYHYHQWSTPIAKRTAGNGCPYCSGQKLHINDSAYHQLSPDLLSEFKQELNPTINLQKLSIASYKSLIWKCSTNENHEPWKARIRTRIKGKNNCPQCEPQGTKIPFEKSVAFLFPHLVSEYHSDNHLSLKQLSPGSGRLVKWICQFRKHHVFESRVAQKVKGHGCPLCRNAPTLPELRFFSELSLFFPCQLHHKIEKDKVDIYLPKYRIAIEWDSYYYHTARLQSDINKTKSLLKKGVKVIRVRDQRLKKINIKNDSLKVIYHPHENLLYSLFQAVVQAILLWEPLEKQLLQPALCSKNFSNDLLFNKLRINRGRHVIGRSLAESYPRVALYWHPIKNGQIKPTEVMPLSLEKYWWKCLNCAFEWFDKISNTTKRKNTCTSCSKQIASPDYNLLNLFPSLAEELLDIDPSKITPHSNIRGKWRCKKCTFEWVISVNGRTGKGKNGCPKCSGKILTHKTSLAGICPDAAKAWDFEKNTKKPEEIFPGTHQKCFFQCICGNSFETRPQNFAKRNKRRCNNCSKKRAEN